MIRDAASRAGGHVRRTPLLNATGLDKIAGRQVFVKAECLQHTGSFKYRGARAAISALAANGATNGVIAFSSGNHAQGVARAAAEHGLAAVIVMPADAPRAKIDGTRALGAEVVPYDRATEDRDAIGAKLAKERGLTLVKPFDEPEVIAGQGSVGLELAEQARAEGIERAEVLVCCGGGGLTSGIATALAEEAPGLIVRPVEPVGFDDVGRSLKAGRIERNAQTTGSICDAILTPAPGEITFPIIAAHCGPALAVPDEDCLRAMAAAFRHLKLVLEPGGAIALAAALFHGAELSTDPVIAIASGGNVDADLFARALATYGEGP